MSKKNPAHSILLTTFVAVISVAVFLTLVATASRSGNFNLTSDASTPKCNSRYNPTIVPTEFSPNITNPYFTLAPGMTLSYENEDGTERVEISVEGTKRVNGVLTRKYHDRVFAEGEDGEMEFVEDTIDYLAQDTSGEGVGDVWYFGEDVDNYENGVIVNHDGSWLYGRNGAKPGIWVKANPHKGDTYLQECLRDAAEDMVEVKSINARAQTKYGTFTGCLKTLDTTRLDPDARENKFYCKQVNGARGAFVLEVDLTSGDRLELTSIGTQDDEDDEEDDDDEE